VKAVANGALIKTHQNFAIKCINMIPKDKAIELYCKYIDAYNDRNLQVSDYKFAKQCALIAVDEIIKSKPHEWDGCDYYSMEDYWKQVLIEINKL
jgi:hypothetical protein